MTLRTSIACLALLAVAACGDDDKNPNADATTTTATDATSSDTASDTTTSATDTAVAETTATTATDVAGDTTTGCDHNGFTAVAQDAGPFLGAFLYIAQSTLDAPVDTLNIELVEAAGGATAAGTFTLTDDGYDSCANCVLVYQGCDAELGNCDKIFLARAGTLTIDTFGESGGQFAGTLTDVELIEVTLDEEYVSTPVADGETWCLESYAFSATVQ